MIDYIRAGARSLDDLKAGISKEFDTYRDSEEQIFSELMIWETRLFDRFVRSGMDVLVVGAGSGRDTLELIARGCRVTGIEPSGVALRLAEQALARQGRVASLMKGFIEDLTIPGPFDLVFFSDNTYTIIPEAKRRIAVLRQAASLLKPQGHVLISYESGLIRARPIFIHAGRLAGALTGSDWRLEPGDYVKFGIDHPDGIYFGHFFVPAEISREVAEAGLDMMFHAELEENQWAAALAPADRDRAAGSADRPALPSRA